MKITGGVQENGIVVGNTYDKYGANNPVVRWIMRGFADALCALVSEVQPQTIHEVGCGEGYWVIQWNRQGLNARGSDFSSKSIELARTNAVDNGVATDRFEVRSIYDLSPQRHGADLVVCCEVLEHLDEPDKAMRVLRRVARKHVIVSVPREPIWRVLNVARGKYLTTLGNTPGHVQHWSKLAFIEWISEYMDVVQVRSPFPWTMLLCRGRT